MRSRLSELPRSVLVSVFSVLTMGPLVLLAYFSVSLSSDAVRQRVRESLQVEATIAALYVRQEMQGLAEVTQSFARRPVLVRALRGGPRRYDAAAIRRNLVEISRVRPGIGTAFVARPDGRLVDIVPPTPSIVGKDFSFRDWYRGVTRSGAPYVSEAYQTQASNRANVVGVAAPVRDFASGGRAGERLAILVLAYRLDTIQSVVSRFAQGQELGLTITDQRGTVLAAPGLAPGAPLATLARDSLIAAALAGRSGVGERRRHDRESVLAWAPVPELGWTVLAEVPASRAFAGVATLRRTVLSIAAVLALVLLAGIWLLNITLRSRQQAQDEVRHLARTDTLTSLPNRRAWDEALPRELARARRDGLPVSVGMIDLDYFKAFNDSYGHQAGDELLADAATAWTAQMRTTDLLARYGGEEFVIVLPNCAQDDAHRVLERIRDRVPEGQTCSIGFACWDGEESGEHLVARADAGLYRAMREGRHRMVSASAAS